MSVRHKQDIRRIRGDKIAWINSNDQEPGVSNISHLINQVTFTRKAKLNNLIDTIDILGGFSCYSS